MKRPMRGDMPLALTLPLHFDLGLRTRRRRLRRFLFAALALAVAALLAGLWLPAKAAGPSANNLRVGDAFTLERDGVVHTYDVVALDVVDSTRLELAPNGDEQLVSLVTPWPFDAVTVGGNWRYVVTARQRF